MPAAIVESASLGDAIDAPLDADVRNAASVRTPFQAVGNRLKFLENAYNLLKVWILGGAITPAAPVTVNADVSVNGFNAAGASAVYLGLAVQGALNFFGSSGRLQLPGVAMPNADASIDAIQNKFIYIDTGNGAHTLTLTSAVAVADGDWFVINNRSGQIQTLAGLVTGTIAASAGLSRGALWVRIGGAWKVLVQWPGG